MQISIKKLVDVLNAVRGASFATLTTYTMPEVTNSFYDGRIYKLHQFNGCLNNYYGNSVNRQREREGIEEHFTPLPPSWGERIWQTPFKTYNDKLYLVVKPQTTLQLQYFLDGKKVEEDAVSRWLKPHKCSKRQKTEKGIPYRNYSVSNIVQVIINHEIYDLKPSPLAA